jgi:transcription elongation factor GreA
MSRDILKKLKEQIKVLEEELHIELPRALKVAREHGDLSENAEYDAAKERQGYVNARLGQLRKRLADLSMVNFDRIPKGKVSFGSQVTLYDYQKEEEVIYKLVIVRGRCRKGPHLDDLSHQASAPRQKGEEVKAQTPSGLKAFEIVKLLAIHDLVDRIDDRVDPSLFRSSPGAQAVRKQSARSRPLSIRLVAGRFDGRPRNERELLELKAVLGRERSELERASCRSK